MQLRRLSEALRGLRWMPLAEASVSAMLQAHLRLSLRERCAGRFESCVMERQLDWIDASVLPWVSAALESGAPVGAMLAPVATSPRVQNPVA